MPEEEAVQKILEFVRSGTKGLDGEKSDAKGLSLQSMAKATGLSKWHFHRVFKKVVGLTPMEYAKALQSSSSTSLASSEVPDDVFDLSLTSGINLEDWMADSPSWDFMDFLTDGSSETLVFDVTSMQR
jgi:methylphosphotriester-DNA--protein-cysteine methyltransferase